MTNAKARTTLVKTAKRKTKMFKKFTDLPENNKSVSLFRGLKTGAEFALEVKFRELLGERVFKALVELVREGV